MTPIISFSVMVHRNVECPIQVLPSVPWLDCLSEEVLHFVPKVFDGVHVWTLCKVHGQFVNYMRLSHATENNFNSAQKRATRSTAWIISDMIIGPYNLTQFVNCQTAYDLELFSIIYGHPRCARCK